MRTANHAASGNGTIGSLFHIGRLGRGVPEPPRLVSRLVTPKHYSKRYTAVAILSTVALIGTACLTSCSHTFYGLTLCNDSPDPIADSTVVYGSRVLEFGNVVPHSSRGYGTVRLPIPDAATVKWKHDSGKNFEAAVALRKLIPKPKAFEGEIVIHISDRGAATVEIGK